MNIIKKLTFITLAFVLYTVLFASLSSVGSISKTEDSPNILLILTDDLGWADFSEALYPDQPDAMCNYFNTPNMNSFAKESMVFTNAYAPAPNCTPSRRSIQFGMTPARQRGTEFRGEFDGVGYESIAEYIKKVNPNYRCAVYGKWGRLMDGSEYGHDNRYINPDNLGYDVSDGPRTGNPTGTFYHRSKKDMYPRNYTCEPNEDPKRTFSLTNRAISFLKEQAKTKQPFYMQVNYYAIHTAHQALAETMKKYESKDLPSKKVLPGVGPMLEDLDAGIGKLLDALENLGLSKNTYVILASDNGGERPYIVKIPTEIKKGRNHPLRAYKGTLYEGGIRVPFMVRSPKTNKNSICNEPIALYDLLPTFYDMVGGKDRLPNYIDGRSITKLLKKPTDTSITRDSEGLVFHRPKYKRDAHSAIRKGNYKLVVHWKKATNWNIRNIELFDLSKDIGETENLAAEMPQKTEQLFTALTTYLKDVKAEKP